MTPLDQHRDTDDAHEAGATVTQLYEHTSPLEPDAEDLDNERPDHERICTETHIADLLFAHHGDSLKFVQDLRRWYYFDGRVWVEDVDSRYARGLVLGIAKNMAEEWIPRRDAAEATLFGQGFRSRLLEKELKPWTSIVRWAQELQNGGHDASVLKKAETGLYSEHHIHSSKFNSNPDLITLRNCTVDLGYGRGASRPHSREDYCSRYLDFDRDESARGQCPEFMAHLNRLIPSQAERENLQALAGATLTGRGERCENFGVIHGPAGNGKSTLLKTLQHLMGELCVVPKKNTLFTMQKEFSSEKDYDIARMRGARMIYADEWPRDGSKNPLPLDESLVQQLSDGGTVTGREIRGQPMSFKSEATVWIASNYYPNISTEQDNAVRRIMVFNTNERLGDPDPSLFERIIAEASAILEWMIEGAAKWNRNLPFPKCEAVKASVAAVKQNSDVYARFFEECCDPKVKVVTKPSRVYEHFAAFMRRSGERPITATMFGTTFKRLPAAGWDDTKRAYTGFGLIIEPGDRFAEGGGEP